MRHLVTGGSGYFGESLVKKLLADGKHVRIFDLNRPSFHHFNLEVVQGTIVSQSDVLAACQDVDVIYHCVAQVPIAKDRQLFWSVNYDGMENLLQAAAQHKVSKIIYISSSAVYGVPSKLPVTEQDEPKPQEAYGKAKYAAELLCREYIKKGLDISIIRPRTILGHGRLGIFQILFDWIFEGYNVPVLGNGKNLYQFVHADDLADACILAAQQSGSDVFNIGALEYGTMEEAIQHLIHYAKSSSKVRHLPFRLTTFLMNLTSLLGVSPLGPYHALMYGRSMYFDISHAQTKLGFHPRYSNDDMFRGSYQWYVDHRGSLSVSLAGRSKHQSPMKQGILSVVKKIL